MPHTIACRGRVPLDVNNPLPPRGDLGNLDARFQSFCPEAEYVTLRLDARHNLEFWAEPRFSLTELAAFLLEEEGIELTWRRDTRHHYETVPVTMQLANGAQFQTKMIKNMSDVNVGEYLT